MQKSFKHNSGHVFIINILITLNSQFSISLCISCSWAGDYLCQFFFLARNQIIPTVSMLTQLLHSEAINNNCYCQIVSSPSEDS